LVITDLGVLRPDPEDHELTLVATHPGIEVGMVRNATGWDLRIAVEPTVSEPPTPAELEVLRALKAKTAAAHATPNPFALRT
jgi:hypothetical protein